MMDLTLAIAASPDALLADPPLQWGSRYDGLVAIAKIGDKAVAGISGPWSAKYALTWWGRPQAACRMELFDTLEAAKREVEDWADRMSRSHSAPLAAANPPSRAMLHA